MGGSNRRRDGLPSIEVRLRKNTGQQLYDPYPALRSALKFCHVTVPANSCLAMETRARIPLLMITIQDTSHLTADMGSSLFLRVAKFLLWGPDGISSGFSRYPHATLRSANTNYTHLSLHDATRTHGFGRPVRLTSPYHRVYRRFLSHALFNLHSFKRRTSI
jgi:hypothetical protein